ncbi:MAG: hypothetical protein V1725_03785 [archaeon]
MKAALLLALGLTLAQPLAAQHRDRHHTPPPPPQHQRHVPPPAFHPPHHYPHYPYHYRHLPRHHTGFFFHLYVYPEPAALLVDLPWAQYRIRSGEAITLDTYLTDSALPRRVAIIDEQEYPGRDEYNDPSFWANVGTLYRTQEREDRQLFTRIAGTDRIITARDDRNRDGIIDIFDAR